MKLDRNQKIVISLVAVAAVVVATWYFYTLRAIESSVTEPTATTTVATTTVPTRPIPGSTPTSTSPKPAVVLPYGSVTLAINKKATFKDVSIRPLSIKEDSRCASDVQCVWAGRLVVNLEIISAMGTSNQTIEIGQSITTEAEKITLTDATPYPITTHPIKDSDYRLTFSVTKIPPPSTAGKCYIGGCSSQLCTDQPSMVSTCEYRNQYACYQTSICERQSTGKCGWTETDELKACLANTK